MSDTLFLCSNLKCGKELGTQDKVSFGKWRGKNITLCSSCASLIDKTLGFTKIPSSVTVETEAR